MAPTDLDPSAPTAEAATQYASYMRTGELLALQRPREARVHPDELLFQIVHQGTELLLKFATEQVEDATTLLGGGRPADAKLLLQRTAQAISLCTQQTELLRQLTPAAFTVVRTALGEGSGFQSPGWHDLRAQLRALSEAFDGYLIDHGVTLLSLYGGSPTRPLYQLAEALVDVDERIALWRAAHYLLATRMLGNDGVGTQGTPVTTLATLIERHLFPQLWAVRAQLADTVVQL